LQLSLSHYPPDLLYFYVLGYQLFGVLLGLGYQLDFIPAKLKVMSLYVTHGTCVGNRPKGASDWLIRIVIRSGLRAGTLVVCLYFLESAVNVIRKKQIGG
jgi:hypothetical protein